MRKSNTVAEPRIGQAGSLHLFEVERVSGLIERLYHGTGTVAEIFDDELMTARVVHELAELRHHDHTVATIRMNVRRLAESMATYDKSVLDKIDWPDTVKSRVVTMLRAAESRKRTGVWIRIRRDLIPRLDNAATAQITVGIEHYLATGSWPLG